MSGSSVARDRGNALKVLFGRAERVLIGVVHLLPLPGSPDYDAAGVTPIYDRALADARAYAEAGFDGLIVENHGDIPFPKPEDIGPETAAHMAVASDRVRRETGLPVGINVLANAALHALAVASAAGAALCPRQSMGQCLCRQRRLHRRRCGKGAALSQPGACSGTAGLRRRSRQAWCPRDRAGPAG